MKVNEWVERAAVGDGRRPFLHQTLEKFGKLISVPRANSLLDSHPPPPFFKQLFPIPVWKILLVIKWALEPGKTKLQRLFPPPPRSTLFYLFPKSSLVVDDFVQGSASSVHYICVMAIKWHIKWSQKSYLSQYLFLGLSEEEGKQQPVDVLQRLLYTAAQIGAEEFIRTLFSTSAGRIVFESYKNRSPLPEDIADANGHDEIAGYFRSITERYCSYVLNLSKWSVRGVLTLFGNLKGRLIEFFVYRSFLQQPSDVFG